MATVESTQPERTNRLGKRFYSQAHKRAIVEKCLMPGASVSAVALAHGFNTNLVRKWIAKHQAQAAVPSSAPKLIPVRISETKPEAPSSVVIDAPPARGTRGPESSIEIDLGVARVVLRGTVSPAQLRVVIDALARTR